MRIYCFVVDDELHSTQLMVEYIERTEGLELVGFEYDPISASKKILSGEIQADLTFLDIEMKGMDGMELGKLIKHETGIIFTTGHRDYAPEAYELDAIDYLLKPIRYVRFVEAIEKAKRYLSSKFPERAKEGSDSMLLRDVMNGRMVKVDNADLLYIEGHGNFVLVHTKLPKPIMTNMSMTGIAAKVTSQRMVQVHKRFIVNIAHVESLFGNEITMANGNKVPLSRRYRKQFLDTFGK